jgi:uncharacterized MAPEG superfamily protein
MQGHVLAALAPAYAIIYVAGAPWLRTAIWAVSVIGLLLILLQLM